MLNLDPYAEAYGWDKFPASQLESVAGRTRRHPRRRLAVRDGHRLHPERRLLPQGSGRHRHPTEDPGRVRAEPRRRQGHRQDPADHLRQGRPGLLPVPAPAARPGHCGRDHPVGLQRAQREHRHPAGGDRRAHAAGLVPAGLPRQGRRGGGHQRRRGRVRRGQGRYFVSGNWQAPPSASSSATRSGSSSSRRPRARSTRRCPTRATSSSRRSPRRPTRRPPSWTSPAEQGRQLVVANKGLAPGGPTDAAAPQLRRTRGGRAA